MCRYSMLLMAPAIASWPSRSRLWMPATPSQRPGWPKSSAAGGATGRSASRRCERPSSSWQPVACPPTRLRWWRCSGREHHHGDGDADQQHQPEQSLATELWCTVASSLIGATPARAAPSRQSAGLTDQPTGQSSVSPEAAAAAVLTDTGHHATNDTGPQHDAAKH